MIDLLSPPPSAATSYSFCFCKCCSLYCSSFCSFCSFSACYLWNASRSFSLSLATLFAMLSTEIGFAKNFLQNQSVGSWYLCSFISLAISVGRRSPICLTMSMVSIVEPEMGLPIESFACETSAMSLRFGTTPVFFTKMRNR